MGFLLRKSHFLVFTILALCGMGVVSYSSLPVSLYPVTDAPVARTTLYFEGASLPFSRSWGRKFESAIKTIKDVNYLESRYKQGKVFYYVHFNWHADRDEVKKSLEAMAASFAARLPDHLPNPVTDMFDASLENYVVIKPYNGEVDKIAKLLEENLLPQLEAIDGVSRAWLSKPFDEAVEVQVNPYKLIENGVEFNEVNRTLTTHRFDKKLGDFDTDGSGAVAVSINRQVDSPEQLAQLPVFSAAGAPLKLSDVADVSVHREKASRFFMYDNKEVLGLAIWPEPTADLYSVAGEFKQKIISFVEPYAEVKIINDPGVFIDKAIINIIYAVLLGIAGATVVVLIFYRKLTPVLLIFISIPLSLGVSVMVMMWLGVGINILSLGAVSICIGMILDSVVLMIDNIYGAEQDQQSPLARISEIVSGTAPTLLAAIATSVVIYLPLLYTAPMVAALLGDIALVAIAILLVSYVISVFFVPAIMVGLLNLGWVKIKTKAESADAGLFKPVMKWYFRKAWLSGLITVAALGFSIYAVYYVLPGLSKEIIASPKAEIMDVEIRFSASGLSGERRAALLQSPVNLVTGLVGDAAASIFVDVRQNSAYISVRLKDYQQFDHYFERLKSALKPTDEYAVDISPWITSALKVSNDPHLSFLFHDRGNGRDYAAAALGFLKQLDGVERARMVPNGRTHQTYNLELKSAIARQVAGHDVGIAETESVLNQVKYMVQPYKLYDLHTEQGNVPLTLSLSEHSNIYEAMATVPVKYNDQLVLLDDLFNVKPDKLWSEYYAYNGQPFVRVNLHLKQQLRNEAGVEQVKAQMLAHLQQSIDISEDDFVVLDTLADTNQSLVSLTQALTLSVVLVLLILVYHFEGVLRAVIAMSPVIYAVCGAMLALLLFDLSLSLNALLGIMILTGLCVNNAIILIDKYDANMTTGLTHLDALVLSISQRSKALWVTNLTTIVGMLPLAIGFGPGKDIVKPLGTSVSVGLLFSTLLTVLTVPTFFRLFANARQKQAVNRETLQLKEASYDI